MAVRFDGVSMLLAVPRRWHGHPLGPDEEVEICIGPTETKLSLYLVIDVDDRVFHNAVGQARSRLVLLD